MRLILQRLPFRLLAGVMIFAGVCLIWAGVNYIVTSSGTMSLTIRLIAGFLAIVVGIILIRIEVKVSE